ncbi:Tubulin-specific chaperone D [Choanephora cucurbitarum]|uniref:Tubulin-specific chaperone D n=1 Tax=Choanephora cucurbitarum TaxID=101091 RepID=A0A1C7NSY2_9FUNG|nr:Tubulin-specific chaperone D [Choanephora cucurbitarum]
MEEDLLMEEHVCASQRSHFEHKEEFLGLVEILTRRNQQVKVASDALDQMAVVLDSYQEQAHLLDPSLESMIEPTMKQLRHDIEDKKLVTETTNLLFRFMYLLTKTRGYKTIVKFMSHEVTDLEPVFECLSNIDSKRTDLWEARYVCFIWLSLICMIPFDLKRIDSGQQEKSLIEKMLDLCKSYLCSTGKERDGASLLIARLLSRQDLCSQYLIPYIEWAKQRLGSDADVFETTGILQSLCITYQLSPRSVLLPTLDDTIMPLLSMRFFDDYANNSLIRKLRTKLTQRVGLCYLRPKVASWRYKRGNRSLRQNLENSERENGLISNQSIIQKHQYEKEEEEEEEEISDSLEVVIEILLNGLRDKDTIVRWSSAKGIGRITQRLPQELAEDVVGSLLELFEENTLINKADGSLNLSAVSDHTWHGASLAIAELARRGLLLPDRLEETIPWILRGLKFDLKRGSHSIGAHVRDACCYVCWAFARAYAPEIIQPFVTEIARNLVVVSMFDREVNVRRASSAAFQENVGRQGIFPHGIEIIQKADYFSLGNRNTAFLNISFDIARFDEYRYHLIQHLALITSKHWDKAMRILASKALYNLVALDPVYFIRTVLPTLIPEASNKDMQISHGALLAIAEISSALYHQQQPEITEQYYQLSGSLEFIISQIPPKSLTTFGSEHTREAACHLMTCLSQTQLKISDDTLLNWKKVIHTSLERKEESVQEFAVLAFGSVAKAFGFKKEELDMALKKVDSQNINYYSRRGYALALGTIDYCAYPEGLHRVILQLCKGSQYQDNHNLNDAEAKRNAVIGLNNVLLGLGDRLKTAISLDDFQLILQSLEECFRDYSTDQRGDVGSWVRTAAMDLVDYLLPHISELDSLSPEQPYLSIEHTSRIIAAILKQSVERIDKVRANAGKVLCNLVLSSEHLQYPGQDCLRKYIRRDLSWSTPSDLYPVMVHILAIPEYRFELLSGLIASAGGLTESLVRHSSACLIDYMNNLPVTEPTQLSLEVMFKTLSDIMSKHEKQDRVTIPLLDVIGLLYESGTLLKITKESLHIKLFNLVKKENFKSKNIRKLLASIKVYVGLISVESQQVRTKALQQLLTYLVHAFPRIRIETSDQLFTQLSISEEADESEDMMEAIGIITGTDWTQPMEQIKAERDKLYALLNIPKPMLVKK